MRGEGNGSSEGVEGGTPGMFKGKVEGSLARANHQSEEDRKGDIQQSALGRMGRAGSARLRQGSLPDEMTFFKLKLVYVIESDKGWEGIWLRQCNGEVFLRAQPLSRAPEALEGGCSGR